MASFWLGRRLRFSIRTLFTGSVCACTVVFQAVLAGPEDNRNLEVQRAQERSRTVREHQPVTPDVRLQPEGRESADLPVQLPIAETPSFPVRRVVLQGEEADRFRFALKEALRATGLRYQKERDGSMRLTGSRTTAAEHASEGVPLGAQGIGHLLGAVQNAVIGRGYTTTRILAEPQDLTSGTLTFRVIAGRVGSIVRVREAEGGAPEASSPAVLAALPVRSGEILNLRRLEQGLENLSRVPGSKADIKIVPGSDANTSDLLVALEHRPVPLRLAIGIDNTGTHRTGKYQGSVTLSVDNPLGLQDLFSITIGRNLGGSDPVSIVDDIGDEIDTRHGRSSNWNISCSIPYGSWLLGYQGSRYTYHQVIPGYYELYSYSGTVEQHELGLSRVVYRDARRKTTGMLNAWTRRSRSFIDDAEIDLQRRSTAGWQIGLSHKEHFPASVLELALSYRLGTGAMGAMRAPEELFGEGTSRMRIMEFGVHYLHPFAIGRQSLYYSGRLRGQLNGTRLLPHDQLAIGGQSSVRGFDGTMNLVAERGFIWRNELGWSIERESELYAFVDVGQVYGPSVEELVDQRLVGAGLGVRGQHRLFGLLQYDLFAGVPLSHPDDFQSDEITVGFMLNYVL